MPRGRPRKPTELKKLEGTYRKDRDIPAEKAESVIQKSQILFPEEKRISCPKTIKTKFVRSYWKKLTSMLIQLKVLSYADIPQLEQLCIILEKLREVQETFSLLSPLDENFEHMQKLFINLSNKFDQLGSKYYISPQARTKLILDNLTATKTQQEIQKNDNAIERLIQLRK
jgi:phage terminase small subunit